MGNARFKEVERPRSSDRVYNHNNLELLTGRSNPELAHAVARLLHKEADEPIVLFADNEKKPKASHNLRKRDVFILQSASPPHGDEYFMELFLMIDAARRASAAEITAVLPYMGYTRQERKDEPRVSISTSLVSNILTYIGAHRIVTLDLHAEASQGNVLEPWDNLHARFTLMPRIKKDYPHNNFVLVGPDLNAMKRAAKDAKLLKTSNIAGVYKERDVQPNSKSDTRFLIGSVSGQNGLLTDDIWATGGSMINAAKLLKQNGANHIIAAATHGLFLNEVDKTTGKITWNALEELTNSPIEHVYVTDTVAQRPEVVNHPKITVVSIAPLLARAIRNIHTGQGLKELFE